MKSRKQFRHSCGKKIKHATYDVAFGAAVNLTRWKGRVALPYQCRYCGGWHVGHTIKTQDQKPGFDTHAETLRVLGGAAQLRKG